MAVIAVYSVKGGVGKTTIAVDLAWRCASIKHQETLLWDLDVQGGSGYLLGHDPQGSSYAAGVFQREGRPERLIVPTPYPRLSLLPGDNSLRDLPVQLARIGHGRRLARLTQTLGKTYERIVLDCPPLINQVSDQIIAAADVIVLPLTPSPLAARAMEQVRRELARHEKHPPLLPVLTMYDPRRRLHRAAREGYAAGWPVVPASSLVEQVAARRAPIATYAGWTDTAQAIERIWRAVENKLREIAPPPSAAPFSGAT